MPSRFPGRRRLGNNIASALFGDLPHSRYFSDRHFIPRVEEHRLPCPGTSSNEVVAVSVVFHRHCGGSDEVVKTPGLVPRDLGNGIHTRIVLRQVDFRRHWMCPSRRMGWFLAGGMTMRSRVADAAAITSRMPSSPVPASTNAAVR